MDRPFSLARAMKNKEHRAVAGLAIVRGDSCGEGRVR